MSKAKHWDGCNGRNCLPCAMEREPNMQAGIGCPGCREECPVHGEADDDRPWVDIASDLERERDEARAKVAELEADVARLRAEVDYWKRRCIKAEIEAENAQVSP
jgi:hypothetical protein